MTMDIKRRLLKAYDFYQSARFRLRYQPQPPRSEWKVMAASANQFDLADPNRVLLLDVAHWDSVVDWKKAKAAGVRGAIIKGKDGTLTDRYFAVNYAGAKAEGLPRGVYGWLYPASAISPGTQARSMYDLVKDDLPELGIWIDYEWTKYDGKQANPDQGDLYGYVIPSEQAFGRKPGIYSAPGYLGQYPLTDPMWDDYLVWLAHYGVTFPDVPPPWKDNPEPRYILHQWTETLDALTYGGDPLVVHAFDGNYFNGSLEQFDKFVADGTVTPPDPNPNGEPTMSYAYKITATGTVNERNNGDDIIIPGAPPSGTDVGDFQPASVGYGNEVKGSPSGSYYCLHVLEIDGQPADCWVYARHNSLNTKATIEAMPITPPPPPTEQAPTLEQTLVMPDGTKWSFSATGTKVP